MVKELGVNYYRFSISWPRIFPDGSIESLNTKGVEFYDNLIDGLLREGIEPVVNFTTKFTKITCNSEITFQVTMFHWDLPQSLQDLGGFLDSNISDHFRNYANFLFSHFGDRVKTWITLNEPLSVAQYGHCGQREKHAPGNFSDNCEWTMYLVAHRLLQCHLKMTQLYNEKYRSTQNGNFDLDFPTVLSAKRNFKARLESLYPDVGTSQKPMPPPMWKPRNEPFNFRGAGSHIPFFRGMAIIPKLWRIGSKKSQLSIKCESNPGYPNFRRMKSKA